MVAFYSHAWKIFIMPGFFSCHPSQIRYDMNLGLFLKTDCVRVQLMSHEYLHGIRQPVFLPLLQQQQLLCCLTPIECPQLGFVILLFFSHPVVSSSFRTRGLQLARPPWPSHHQEFAQARVPCIGDAIQSHPLMPSSPVLSLSQHQWLFHIACPHQMTKIPELQLLRQSIHWIFRVDLP